ncbi:MAG: hypothetical protein RIQ79_2440 [Verrucomicrobiota bacterium]
MPFRKVFFWLHLIAGLAAGLVILVMSATGVALAFEDEIVAWAERDVRRVEPPSRTASSPGNAELQLGSVTAPLPLDTLLTRAREALASSASPKEGEPSVASVKEGPRVTGITVSADLREAVAVNFGRETGVYYVNPYTGQVSTATTTRTHDFLQLMLEWHRFLARTGEQRPVGKAVTGACNLAFLFLAVSGLWLWWPRAWNRRVLRPSLWFVRGASGRARDWNWHNVVGFWSLPVLIVLTISGAVIGYRWAGDLVYRAAGETPPATRPSASPGNAELQLGSSPATPAIERPEGVKKLTYAAALARIQAEVPGWQTITLREGLAPRRAAPVTTLSPGNAELQLGSVSSAASAPERPRAPQPYSATIKADDNAPAFATTTIVLNPYTGEVLSRTGYADQTTGRKARSWLRYLHTGQALGWPGQLLAGLASVGGCLLVYTGFALSWRRFFGRKSFPST